MIAEKTTEERLAIVEQAVAELQARLRTRQAKDNWLDRVIGSVTDIEAFDEAMAIGRAFRDSDRPREVELGS